MTSTESAKREIIFLFGAGASIDAGIPDTYKFVEDFAAHIKSNYPQLSKSLSNIIKIRESYNKRIYGSEKQRVDVEQLLDTLRRLINREKEPLLDFYEEKQFCKDLPENDFSEMQKLLEDFIREKVIAKEEKLEYLKGLLKFDTPIEIYSTNYDTCIEQLSYLNHMRYTDGFDVYWNKKNFDESYDVKHYKLHGSIIWYQNIKTKECVKIPVHAFSEGKSVNLQLIYGEDVTPLLIYPAQKSYYIEPLTDLQLMFKERLFNKETKVVVIVGYSFRDDYIIHMLWDAARANEDLHIILIAPNSKEIFDRKLKFIEKDSPSRIQGRVICLPYPFSTVISLLKNNYLRNLSELRNTERDNINKEKRGEYVNWEAMLQNAIDCEFLTKAESTIEKLGKDWGETEMAGRNSQSWLHYAIKGLLSSIALEDGNEDIWIKRVNKSLKFFDAENLHITGVGLNGVNINFRVQERNYQRDINFYEAANYWIDPVFSEREQKRRLLGPAFETKLVKISKDFDTLVRFGQYVSSINFPSLWKNYIELRSNDKDVSRLSAILSSVPVDWEVVEKMVLDIERRTLKEAIGANSIQFDDL